MDYVLTVSLNEKDIERLGLTEEFKTCETEQDKEDFLNETLKAALTVYGQANKKGLLSEDYYSLDESLLPDRKTHKER